MIYFILRSLWRLVILLIGISLIYGTVRIYPYADARLPAFVVLLLIYIFFAYIGIPALIRLLRIFIKPNHIPVYASTGDGWPSDPINIAIIARSELHLVKAMQKAGWYQADPATAKNALREAASILFDRPYPTAPFSNLYLFGRAFDIGFQIPTTKSGSVRSRHHVRFWRLQIPDGKSKHPGHYHFWQEKLKHLLGANKEIWIGAAIEDVGAWGIRWRSGQLTHRNSNDFIAERDLIIQTLHTTHQVESVTEVDAGGVHKFRGQQPHNSFVFEGNVKVVDLKRPLLPPF